MHKLFLLFAFYFVSSIFKTFSQSGPATLDVVSWNIEWFGSPGNGPSDNDLQEKNVVKVLRHLNADIYGLVEVVDTVRLRRVVDSLGSNYGYSISSYCSNADSPFDSDWLPGQKLCYIYNKNFVSNPTFRAFMGSSGLAYTSWASGRYPYIMNADITFNGVTKNINFILLHGKAGATTSDYNRRKAGSDQMKDSLDLYYPSSINMIIGDFNDDLDQTIVPGSGPVSSYTTLISDSTDSDHYRSITLPESRAGVSSTLSFSDAVDHQVISNEAFQMYVQGSAKIRKDVATVIPGYLNGNTSDHYPVFSQYNFNLVTGIPYVAASELQIKLAPNPSTGSVLISFGKSLQKVRLTITDIMGRAITTHDLKIIRTGEKKLLDLKHLARGVYIVQVETSEGRSSLRVVRL